MKKDVLTKLQRAFVDEYLKSVKLNATECVRRAGYETKYPDKIASQLLENDRVLIEIGKARVQRASRTQTMQDQVLEELKILAYSDFRNYGEIVKELGIDRLKLKTFGEIEEGKTRAIQSIKETIGEKSVQLSFKLHGKLPALELLGKHIGMFVERMALTGEDGGPLKIEYVLIKAKKKRGGDGK